MKDASQDIHSLDITSDNKLKELSKKLNLNCVYIGFAEYLPKKSKNGLYIINLGNNKIQGTHWTCLFIKNKEGFYSDSFGMPPEDYIRVFCRNNNIKLDWNEKKQLQHINEKLCGVWVLLTGLFLQNNDKKNSLKERFNEFSNNFNDLS